MADRADRLDRMRPATAAVLARLRPVLRGRRDPVLLIGGASGAGKSTFAAAAHAALGGSLVTMEDLYRGWGGLAAGTALLAGLLADRAAGRPATFMAWDWAADRPGAPMRLAATGLLIVEGGGAVTPATTRFATLTVLLDVRDKERIRRTTLRDPADTHELLAAWAIDERRAAAMRPPAADLVLRGGLSGRARGR